MDNSSHDDDLRSAWEKLRHDADSGREPQLISAQLGRRQVSFQALLERIEREFIAEYTDSALLKEADTVTARLKLLGPVVDYVMAVESVQVSTEEKAVLIQSAYSSLFGYGPLDSLLLDDRVTTITLEGADRAAVRYGHGDLEMIGPIFEDEVHLKRILRRVLLDAGADLYDDQPFIETGLRIDGRPVSISLMTPLLSFAYHADIRLHPRELPAFDSLVQSGFLTAQAVELLQAIVRSGAGFVVVGDAESGKTTLLSVLLHDLPDPQNAVAVERAGELRLPEGMRRLVVTWPAEDSPGVTFGEQVAAAYQQQPACMVLDEVRSDEPEMIAPLLSDADAPRQIWSFRGPFDTKRLRNALSMLARRADMHQSEMMVQALYQRLPFVITVWRVRGQLHLYSIGEWQYRDSDYPDYVLLMDTQEGDLRLTGEVPAHPLPLPDSFWKTQ